MMRHGKSRQTVIAGGGLALALTMSMAVTLAGQTPPPEMADMGSSPIRIETLEIEPTVAKTGDLIYQTYRASFPDLISQGREIIILEDRMAPENLPVHPFEAVTLDIEKRQIEDQHVWDFRYGLRLIAPEKSLYVLPGFSFYYIVRDLGEDIEEADVQQVDGGGGYVRYVTTITDLPLLDIRDTIELGSFSAQATMFRSLAWGVAPLPLLVWFVLLARHARRPRVVSLDQQQDEDELARIEAAIPVPPSIWEARRSLQDRLIDLGSIPKDAKPEVVTDVQRSLVIATREYLHAELPDLHRGDTPKDIVAYVDGMPDGARRRALHQLASQLLAFHRGLERDDPVTIPDPRGESQILRKALSKLRPHNRLFGGFARLFGAG